MAHALNLAFRVLRSTFPARFQLSLDSSALKKANDYAGVCFSLFNSLNLPIFFPRPALSTLSPRPSHLLHLILIFHAIRREPI